MSARRDAVEALSGGLAASVALTVTYPLYRAVVGAQSGGEERSLLHRLKELLRAEESVYEGLQSALIATSLQSSL